MSPAYLRLEIRRTFRSTRFVLFAIAFPVIMFLLQATLFLPAEAPHRAELVGVFMVNMMAFGVLSAAMAGGGRLALERAGGWQRQLRLTPLSGTGYLGGKGLSGMLVALPALVLVPVVAVLTQDVHLSAGGWLRAGLGSWLGAVPFVLLGLLLGQFGTPESMQPLGMLVTMTMGFLGGLWVPIDTMPEWLRGVSQLLPSYWLTQVGRGAVTSELSAGLGTAVAVLAGWTVVLGAIVVRRYRRDGARG
ncbi:ABC transporter permease [Amycolatopsis sp. 195334CR]|uniref:ABC transporter permease n=1 Tax=Amycolatopsis sp. 195334CR TaxID=2814588 RepID=UPI001A8F6A5F|nr:ABC transporter permease [Amycolatopsis sp. 195334CR]MBN6037581.1 ABC transporter permease [Amycolatopsis sp. 195334CR]